MRDAVIGNGFVGSNIARCVQCDVYTRSNSQSIGSREYDTVWMAAAPGSKWQANHRPLEDAVAIDSLIRLLPLIRCKKFVLISTVDVYGLPFKVDETSLPCPSSPYGMHRLALENACRANGFPSALVVRLPGLYGPGLKKNVLYDLANKREDMIRLISPDDVYQWFDVRDVWFSAVMHSSCRPESDVLNLVTQPVSMSEIAALFGVELEQIPASKSYDVRSATGTRSFPSDKHGEIGPYYLDRESVVCCIKEFFNA